LRDVCNVLIVDLNPAASKEECQTITEKIQQRRYQMLVHSYIYYQLNDSIVSDIDFDRWSKELVELTERYPEEARKARYHEEFKNFDGSSGFDLPYSLPNIQEIANRLLKYNIKSSLG
jgi:NAD-dependent DNA ligase